MTGAEAFELYIGLISFGIIMGIVVGLLIKVAKS